MQCNLCRKILYCEAPCNGKDFSPSIFKVIRLSVDNKLKNIIKKLT